MVWESSSKILSVNATATRITYRAAMLKPNPIGGWLGFFIQLSFKSIENSVIQVTTEANIVPETWPFEDCTLDGCRGTLV